MHRPPPSSAAPPALLWSALLALVIVLGTLTLAAAQPPDASAHTAIRGVCSDEIQALDGDLVAQARVAQDLSGRLGARVVRVNVSWTSLEPQEGEYASDYLARLSTTVDLLRADGLNVIFTICGTPEWASDSSLWDAPPFGYKSGYRAMYAMREDALDAFGAAIETLASQFKDRVYGYECWNEPNLWVYMYPQKTAADAHFSAHLYTKMLEAFSGGVRAVDPKAKVIAGATAPIGLNDRARTSPQAFARAVKRSGGGRFFDVYSHHPYTVGGSVDPRPGGTPNHPSLTVSLGNITTLLRIFPKKPFYLTEYGYNTAASLVFAGFSVSEKTQARYLRQAYAIADRHPQIKMMLWFQRRDRRLSSGSATDAIYSGLRRLNGSRKPSWYAFKNLGQ